MNHLQNFMKLENTLCKNIDFCYFFSKSARQEHMESTVAPRVQIIPSVVSVRRSVTVLIGNTVTQLLDVSTSQLIQPK